MWNTSVIEIHRQAFLDHQNWRKKNGRVSQGFFIYTAISRKVVGKNVHATIPKGNMGYVQYTVPDTVAVEPTFVAFL